MTRNHTPILLTLAAWLAMTSVALAQPRPYIGFVYPAGGQQGTTVSIRLGGQQLDDVKDVLITGAGARARVVAYHRRLNPQEVQLLREQIRELRKTQPAGSAAEAPSAPQETPSALLSENERLALVGEIEHRLAEYVQPPASASISNIVLAEITLDSDARPGPREIRLVTPRGVTNPLPFLIGQVPEVCRKPMISARVQTLGKEELALRKRPEDEVEQRITLPCTVNGQIASGEVNRYRFTALKSQHLVLNTSARQLVAYIADAVPGWFQPVLTVYDAAGKEVAYDDDDRFKPDPVIRFKVPRNGEYTFTITDALYRGREDFVYRVTVGELPFVTSLFPMGSRIGTVAAIRMAGWNLDDAKLILPARDAGPGTVFLEAIQRGMVSNQVPYALDNQPEAREKEPNNDPATAQPVQEPVIINGRIDRKDDLDVYCFPGNPGERVVAEVTARRLDSSLDSFIKLKGPDGKLLAYNDDHEDPAIGLNTHHADSYLMATLPAAGTYRVCVGDVARSGGEQYAYRLRISPPQPDFALRVVPSSITLRSKAAAALTVQVLRKDGFAGPIKLELKNPPEGFSAPPVTVPKDQNVARLRLKTTLTMTKQPVQIHVQGVAHLQGREVVREAIPAEDRMQAFLWRHLVAASDLWVTVFDPTFKPPPKRVCRVAVPGPPTTPPPAETAKDAPKPKFTKQQVVGRLRQLKLLFEEGLLTDELYARKVAECEAVR